MQLTLPMTGLWNTRWHFQRNQSLNNSRKIPAMSTHTSQVNTGQSWGSYKTQWLRTCHLTSTQICGTKVSLRDSSEELSYQANFTCCSPEAQDSLTKDSPQGRPCWVLYTDTSSCEFWHVPFIYSIIPVPLLPSHVFSTNSFMWKFLTNWSLFFFSPKPHCILTSPDRYLQSQGLWLNGLSHCQQYWHPI